jgi:predicted RND superfamily exporter protein
MKSLLAMSFAMAVFYLSLFCISFVVWVQFILLYYSLIIFNLIYIVCVGIFIGVGIS